jgi:transglutaminase-like putative cysteine protease
MDNPEAYTQATEAVESDHPRIRELAAEITGDATDMHEKARRLFLYVRDQVKYSMYNPFFEMEHYQASGILERGHGYCVQKAVVLAALARASEIPARLIFVDLVNHRVSETVRKLMETNVFTWHAYVEMHLGGKWVKMVPSFDKQLCEENEYPVVEFDGYNDALFPAEDAKGRRYMEYAGHHGAFADVPLDTVLAGWEKTYGKDKVELWKKAFLEGLVPPG